MWLQHKAKEKAGFSHFSTRATSKTKKKEGRKKNTPENTGEKNVQAWQDGVKRHHRGRSQGGGEQKIVG